MQTAPFHRVEPIHYVDADTGAILETVQMRQFFDWDTWDQHRKPEFKMVRQYALDREHIVNPRFRDGHAGGLQAARMLISNGAPGPRIEVSPACQLLR